MKELCFWTVANGRYVAMAQGLVKTYLNTGHKYDFHVISEGSNIKGAINHSVPPFRAEKNFCKIHLLQKIREHKYDWYIFLDSDIHFVHPIPNILEKLALYKSFAIAEDNLDDPRIQDKVWHRCRNKDIVELFKRYGCNKAYNINSGMYAVRRDHIDQFLQSCYEIRLLAMSGQWRSFMDEPAVAYAVQKHNEDISGMLIRNYSELFGTDFRSNTLPADEPWMWKSWFLDEEVRVHPAIYHKFSAKAALIKYGEG